MHTHSPNKLKQFKQTSGRQKADGNCFLEQERSADGGIHATRDHDNVRCVLQGNLRRAIQNKRCGILTSSAVLLQDNVPAVLECEQLYADAHCHHEKGVTINKIPIKNILYRMKW
jgi:hypothetical protein